MPHYLDLDAWPRRSQFEFYRDFDNPFFNVCVDVDVRTLKHWCGERGASFFLASLYASQRATEAVPNFRYRLEGNQVRVQDRCVPGSTVLRDNETFGFGYFQPADTFDAFAEIGQEVIADVKSGNDLEDRPDDGDVIHYSVLPWLSFTSFSHARDWGTEDSVPKIVFGKYEARNGTLMMPVSIAVHHALMDGLHVGRYVEHMSRICKNPEQMNEPPR